MKGMPMEWKNCSRLSRLAARTSSGPYGTPMYGSSLGSRMIVNAVKHPNEPIMKP